MPGHPKPHDRTRRPTLRANGFAKPRSWSHQDMLARLKGRAVCLTFFDQDSMMTATLLESDQWSLLVRHESTGRESIIWKHALSGVSPLPGDAA